MKASRVCALCLVAGSLAGLTGGRVLAQTPGELQQEIDDLRHVQAILSKPGTVLTSTYGTLRTFDRDDFGELMGALVSKGEVSPAQVQRLVFASVAMTKSAREVVAKELEEKEQALARLTANPNAKSWMNYVGTVEGSTSNVVCHNSGPQAARKVAFKFTGDGALSVSGPGQPDTVGLIRSDGTMIARGAGAASSWWGRFRWERNGTISGRGETGSQSGIERCDGKWSVP